MKQSCRIQPDFRLDFHSQGRIFAWTRLSEVLNRLLQSLAGTGRAWSCVWPGLHILRSAVRAGDAIRPPALDEPSLGSLIFEKEAKQLRQAQPLAEGFAGSVGRNVSHGGTSIRSLHSGFRHFAA